MSVHASSTSRDSQALCDPDEGCNNANVARISAMVDVTLIHFFFAPHVALLPTKHRPLLGNMFTVLTAASYYEQGVVLQLDFKTLDDRTQNQSQITKPSLVLR